ncbi:MAG TPA: hypothetical protein VFZ61_23500 [Polyangiales bacterium]
MKTITWINASAVVAVATLALGIAGWDVAGSRGVIRPGAFPASQTVLVAQIETSWLPASTARREIEQRTALIEQFAQEQGIDLRVTDADTSVRTRDGAGARLEEPLFHFARSFEFHVRRPQDVDLLRGTLATWSVDLRDEERQVEVNTRAPGPAF